MEVIREFLDLRIDLPHRAIPVKDLCNYFFEEGLYTKPRVDYASIGARPSRYDAFLHDLVSEFETSEELRLAVEKLERLFTRAARAFGLGSTLG